MQNYLSRISGSAIILVSLLVGGCGQHSTVESTTSEHKPLVVYLVRHAEKTDSGSNPELSPAGARRAELLANTLRSAKIEHIHSTDLIRTGDTAGPTAKKYAQGIELYDAGKLRALADRIRTTGGRHLVVGHSNTTPAMVGLLGGEPGSEINEEREYDRLYIVSTGGSGKVITSLLRYGAPHFNDTRPD